MIFLRTLPGKTIIFSKLLNLYKSLTYLQEINKTLRNIPQFWI